MDVRRLGYFLAVVDQGGFGRAAEHLLIAQPSLSQAVAGLERELGVKLFRRAGRGVVLTDAGTRLIEPARRVLRDVEAAEAAVGSLHGLQQGRAHLVTMPSPGIEPLATLVAALHRRHPGLLVDVEAAFTPEEAVESVRSGRTELGLLGTPGAPGSGDLAVLSLERQPLVLLSPPGRDLPPERVCRQDLTGLPLVASQPGSLMRSLVDDLLAGGAGARITAQVAHRTSILPLVLAGVGHAVAPSSWRGQALSSGAEVHAIEPATHLEVSLVSRRDTLTPAARAFAEVARDHAEQHS